MPATPAESKRQQIIESVISDLRAIKKGSDYWYEFEHDSVSRSDLDIETIKSAETPWCSVIPGPEVDKTEKMPTTDYGLWELYIWLVVESEPEEKRRDMERLLRDVRKKLMSNPGLGLDFVKFAKVSAVEAPLDDDAGYERIAACRVTLTVLYKFEWTSP